MNPILIKIIFSVCIVISMNACHTFEHQNIFIQDVNKISKKDFFDKENKKSKISEKKSEEIEKMAPIDMPKRTQKVQKLALQKKVKAPNHKEFSIKNFINLNEEKIITILGKSDFIKKEGKLKNYQYYFDKCFLDVFLIKKNNEYIVNYIETRPTRLNGAININECLKEIKSIIN